MEGLDYEPAPLDHLESLGSFGSNYFDRYMNIYSPDLRDEEPIHVVIMDDSMDVSNADPLSTLEGLENTAVSYLDDGISSSIDCLLVDSPMSTVHKGLLEEGNLDQLEEDTDGEVPHRDDLLNNMDPYAEIPEPHWEPPAVVGRPPSGIRSSITSSITSVGYPAFQQNNNRPDTEVDCWLKPYDVSDDPVTNVVPNYMSVRRRQPKTSEDEVLTDKNVMKVAKLLECDNTNQSNRGFDALPYVEDGYTTISKYRNDMEDDQQPSWLTDDGQSETIPEESKEPGSDSRDNTMRYSVCTSGLEISTSRQKVIRDDKVRFGTLDPRKLEDVTPSKMVNGRFENPWDTWRDPKLRNAIRFMCMRSQSGVPSKEDLDRTLPVLTPDRHKIHSPPLSGINVTWIGHASLLVQFDGISILTDPIFSEFCGPASLVGYKRYRPVPCTVHMLPKIHAVVISHSHYDHLDLPTVVALNDRFGSHLRWFVPLGLLEWFTQTGVENVIELDWWQENCIPSHSEVTFAFTPSQHWSRRTAFDKHKSLWGSWSIIGPNHSFFFAGDTGYCKGFKEIGQRYGPFDVAAIPIGAYLPRWFLSPQHVDPTQAVQLHQDVQARQSVAIHWGTFELGKEHYLAPRDDLKIALDKAGLCESDFFTLKHGETRLLAAEERSAVPESSGSEGHLGDF